VTTFLVAFDGLLAVLKIGFFGAAAVLAVVAAVDWAVRTRRINPFNPVARFFRTSIDPLMVPVERRIVRAGGLPTSAPWWSLAAVILGGIVLLSVLNFVRAQMLMAGSAAGLGARGLLALAITWAFGILRLALLVSVISSWVRISPYSKWVRWAFVITEPILRPLREFIPLLGAIDVTPIIAYFALGLVQGLLLSLL
jgi:YggT family protein